MHPLKGRKQKPEHIAKRVAAMDYSKRKPGAGRPANTPEVLWSKVAIGEQTACWPWRGFKNHQGYGRTWINNKGYFAHRVIFDLANPGLISLSADGKEVCHKCDNPPCCNPEHLFLGTRQDNVDDKVAKGRQAKFGSLNSPRAKFSREDVLAIRVQKQAGATKVALALLYNVSTSAISGVCYGRTYKDVL